MSKPYKKRTTVLEDGTSSGPSSGGSGSGDSARNRVRRHHADYDERKLRHELEKERAKNSKIAAEIRKLSAENARLLESLERELAIEADLAREVKEEGELYEVDEREIKVLHKMIRDLEGKVVGLRRDLRVEKDRRARADKNNRSLGQQIEMMQEIISGLENDNRRLTLENARLKYRGPEIVTEERGGAREWEQKHHKLRGTVGRSRERMTGGRGVAGIGPRGDVERVQLPPLRMPGGRANKGEKTPFV